MNSEPGRGVQQQAKPPLSEAAKASLAKTRTLFRMFMVSVLGSFFVYQLDVNYLWLAAVAHGSRRGAGDLPAGPGHPRLKESKLVLFGTISGLVVAVVMVLMMLAAMVFFNQVRDYQCARPPSRPRAAGPGDAVACATQFQDVAAAPRRR